MSDPTADLFRRPSLDDEPVRALLRDLGFGEAATGWDLGGTMSLNIHLAGRDAVLRVHPPFVTGSRLGGLRTVRCELAHAGLVVGTPLEFGSGRHLARAGACWAELERYVPHSKPEATWENYAWMFAAAGSLHRALAGTTVALEEPVVATYGAPERLRRLHAATTLAVARDAEAAAVAERVATLLEKLEAQWVPEASLPVSVVHGDVRLGNVARDDSGGPAYFDFGFAAMRPRVHELAYSLSWIVLRPDASGVADEFAWERVDELLSAYEESAAATIEPIERRALGPYLAAVPIYLAAISCHTPDPVARIKEEIGFLHIAEWVLEHPGVM